ncbi:MAG: hypothetical protein ACXVNM_14065 [Bacteroidia bacterium]
MIELFKEDEIKKSGLTAEVLLQKFKEQLLRDFEMCNADSYLSPLTDLSYPAIHANLKQAMEKITKAGSSLYQQLLYRIDVSEKQLAEGLQENRDRAQSDVIAELIIKRILQKVILKVIYSK